MLSSLTLPNLIFESFANNEKLVVILGDNVTTASIKPYVDSFRKQEKGAKVLLKKVNDPTRFGIAAIDEQQIIEIDEKPNKPKSDYAVMHNPCGLSAILRTEIIKQLDDVIRH